MYHVHARSISCPDSSSLGLLASVYFRSAMPMAGPKLLWSIASLGRQPFFTLALLMVFTVFFVIFLNMNSASTLEMEALQQRTIASLVHTEMRSAIKGEIRAMEDRIRFLEEDTVFRRRSSDSIVGKMGKMKKYPYIRQLPESERKRILVTGGSGFVGSHLVDQLMRDGHEVTVVDNFFTGRKKNLEQWIGHDNFELLNHDVVEHLLVEVDQIYHLASPASPIKYMYNPVKTLKTNTIGTLNMLGLAKRVRARFLLASTSEVYGDPAVHPQPEEYWGNVNPIGPRACYDEGKRVSETMAYSYKKQDNVEVRVARIFNTYGPRMHMYDGRVVSNFIIQSLKGEPLTVFEPGNQTRSFMYVSDLVDGLIRLMESNYSLPVNLGNPDEHTILDFARVVQEEVGCEIKMSKLPRPQDDPQRRRPDIRRAERVLHWKPLVSLREGIRRTTEFFRHELGFQNNRTATQQ